VLKSTQSRRLKEITEASHLADELKILHLRDEGEKMRSYMVKWIELGSQKQQLIAQSLREESYIYLSDIRAIDEKLDQLNSQ
jgi:hypothetical protein